MATTSGTALRQDTVHPLCGGPARHGDRALSRIGLVVGDQPGGEVVRREIAAASTVLVGVNA